MSPPTRQLLYYNAENAWAESTPKHHVVAAKARLPVPYIALRRFLDDSAIPLNEHSWNIYYLLEHPILTSEHPMSSRS